MKELTQQSNYTLPPEQQAEQIMAIYPIIDGQQATAEHNKTREPPATSNNTVPADASAEAGDNLISLDDSQAAATPKPAETEAAQTPDEVERMLSMTGKQAEGPLLDFTDDLKKDLPAEPSSKAN